MTSVTPERRGSSPHRTPRRRWRAPYPAHVLVRAVLLALIGICPAAAPAIAAPVLVVGPDGALVRDDPALPPDAMTAPPPGGVRSCASVPAASASAARTVPATVRRVERAGAVTPQQG